jgi:putative AdoMet-dependent methyltransferase
MTDESRVRLFNEWAACYDDAVTDAADFPFMGYARVLHTMLDRADVQPGMTALDIGTGTGNVAARLMAAGAVTTGVDFSAEMLAKAREKVPGVTFVQADLLGGWPDALHRRFDRITAAYVIHEFDAPTKAAFLARLAADHLTPGGRIVVGDIAFPSVAIREQAYARWREAWDESEYYWAADVDGDRLRAAGLCVAYEQISACAGVFVIEAARSDG